MKYVIYTADKDLTDSEFLALGSSYTADNDYNSSFARQVQIAENGTHRIAVVTAAVDCVDNLKVPSIEFLGRQTDRDYSHSNPQDYFTANEWAKIDLASARELFYQIPDAEPEPLPEPLPEPNDFTQEDFDRVEFADINYVFTDRDWAIVKYLKEK